MATEKRLIDANALVEKILSLTLTVTGLRAGKGVLLKLLNKYREGILQAVNEQPTVDAVEVVHGEWSIIEDDCAGLTALQCSECNQEYWFEEDLPMKIYNYCPNCGAKMDLKGE